MKNLLLLYNPNAGRSMAGTRLGDVITYCTGQGYLVTAVPLFSYTAERSNGVPGPETFDKVVLLGGDGTLHHAVNHEIRDLGYIPCGSANDVGHSLGIPMSIDDSMKVAIHGTPHAIDLGQFNNDYFVYVAAFGLFTEVTYQTPQKMKKDLGYLAYLLEGIRSLTDVKSYHLKISCDEENAVEGDYLVGLVANSYSIAGFRNPMSDDISLDDGKFEGVFIRMPRDLIELNLMIGELMSGKTDSARYDYFKASSITITSTDEISWTLDGDFGGRGTTARLQCLDRGMVIRQ